MEWGKETEVELLAGDEATHRHVSDGIPAPGDRACRVVDLRTVASEILATFRPGAGLDAPYLINGVDPDLPDVLVDDRKLRQILQNLISHAVQVCAHGLIVVGASVDGQWVKLTVAERATIPAARPGPSDPGSGQVASGLGSASVGLAIATRLIERDGGRLDITSEAGRGATISFTLTQGEA